MTTAERLARTKRRIAQATAPLTVKRGSASRGHSLGDGLPCPDGHGAMYRFAGSSRHWCAHSVHGGNGLFVETSES